MSRHTTWDQKFMDYIYIDIETNGLIEKGVPPAILCTGWFIDEETNGLTHPEYDWRIMAEDRKPVFHNSKFEVGVFQHYGIYFDSWEDTMLMAYLWDQSEKDYSLEALGDRVGVPKMNKPWGKNNPTEFSRELWEYCINDCRVTKAVHEYYLKLYETDPDVVDCYRLELNYQTILIEMERNGMHIDTTLLQPIEEELAQKMCELELEAREYVAIAPGETIKYKKMHPEKQGDEVGQLKLVGIDQNGDYVYKKIRSLQLSAGADKLFAIKQLIPGWTSPETTKGGAEAIDDSVLDSVQHPIAAIFQEYSEVSKLHGTYVSKLPHLLDQYGFVHGTFKQCRTITGRLASADPNLQNIPAHGKTAKLIRAAFDAPPGYVVWDFDLSNMEARILAWLCYVVTGATTMVDIFVNKLDFHQENCNNWGFNNLGADDPRFLAKKSLFSDLYGVTPFSLARQINQPVSLIEAMQAQIKAAYPEIQETKEYVWDRCRKADGLMHTPLGRRLYYPDINHKTKYKRARAERQIFNAMIQSTQADILKIRSIELLPIITDYQAFIAAAVHDEKMGYVRETVADEFCNAMQTALCSDHYLLPVPIVSECRYGKNWSEAH